MATEVLVDFSPYKEILNKSNYDYFESPTEVSFKKRKSSAEGTIHLKLQINANEKGELFFRVEGPGIEYTGYDTEKAMKELGVAKTLFDSE